MFLRDPKLVTHADAWIADDCGVGSHNTVTARRAELEQQGQIDFIDPLIGRPRKEGEKPREYPRTRTNARTPRTPLPQPSPPLPSPSHPQHDPSGSRRAA